MRVFNIILFILSIFFLASAHDGSEEWGFFGHRKINRLAVFTCPPPLITFYKKHIEYITEHAVDPDKRRHASKFEAIRHYIDIDHWGEFPFENVPRNYEECIIKFGQLVLVESSDSLYLNSKFVRDSIFLFSEEATHFAWQKREFLSYFRDSIFPFRYEDEWVVNIEDDTIWGNTHFRELIMKDEFSAYGIIPFALKQAHYSLVNAFKNNDLSAIVRWSTDYGHYIADAHVPLHTTENYNGQLTGQEGIHAFWESRLPELYADSEYDFFVGKAEYVEDLDRYYWDIVLDSHSHLEEVLGEEKRIRASLPPDQIFCYQERNGITIRTQCPEFARAYNNAMSTMVEDRFRSSIRAIGSLWYTAWVQAGKPTLGTDQINVQEQEWDTIRVDGKVIGRIHAN